MEEEAPNKIEQYNISEILAFNYHKSIQLEDNDKLRRLLKKLKHRIMLNLNLLYLFFQTLLMS